MKIDIKEKIKEFFTNAIESIAKVFNYKCRIYASRYYTA